MERWTAKVLAIIGIFILPLICTLLPIKVHDFFIKKGRKGEKLLSWMMCFGGGVFFATYILHMGPEVRLILNDALIKPYGITYPLPELIISMGFFLVLFIEKLTLKLQKRKQLDQKTVANLNIDTSKDAKVHTNAICVASPIQNPLDVKMSDINDPELTTMSEEVSEIGIGARSLVLAIALSLHRIFEGMSIGLMHTVLGVGSLFLAVICHEVVIGFSLGLQFVQNKFSTKRIIAYTVVCSIILPLGVGIGTVIIEVGSDGQGLNMVNGILQAISTGTFIYVTFFEILQGEISHADTGVAKSFFLVLGFALMAALSAIPEPSANQ